MSSTDTIYFNNANLHQVSSKNNQPQFPYSFECNGGTRKNFLINEKKRNKSKKNSKKDITSNETFSDDLSIKTRDFSTTSSAMSQSSYVTPVTTPVSFKEPYYSNPVAYPYGGNNNFMIPPNGIPLMQLQNPFTGMTSPLPLQQYPHYNTTTNNNNYSYFYDHNNNPCINNNNNNNIHNSFSYPNMNYAISTPPRSTSSTTDVKKLATISKDNNCKCSSKVFAGASFATDMPDANNLPKPSFV